MEEGGESINETGPRVVMAMQRREAGMAVTEGQSLTDTALLRVDFVVKNIMTLIIWVS